MNLAVAAGRPGAVNCRAPMHLHWFLKVLIIGMVITAAGIVGGVMGLRYGTTGSLLAGAGGAAFIAAVPLGLICIVVGVVGHFRHRKQRRRHAGGAAHGRPVTAHHAPGRPPVRHGPSRH